MRARRRMAGKLETNKSHPLNVLVGRRRCQPPPSRRLSGAGAAQVRRGRGAGAAHGPLRWKREGCGRFGLRGRRSTCGRSGLGCVAVDALSQGSGFVAGAALWQGQVKIPWHAQHFGKAVRSFRGRSRTFPRSGTVSFRGRRNTLARSGADFVACLSQGHVQVAQHFGKVRYRFRGGKEKELDDEWPGSVKAS